MRFILVYLILFLIACKKPVEFKTPKKTFFFVNAFIMEDLYGKQGFVNITIDYFNQSVKNQLFDTSIFKLYLFEDNKLIKLNLTIGFTSTYNATFGINTYRYYSDTGTKPKANARYTLKLYYKGDSSITTSIMPDNIMEVRDILTYKSDRETFFKAKVIDNEIDKYYYLYNEVNQNSIRNFRFFQSFINFPDTNNFIPNSFYKYTGCSYPRGKEPLQNNIFNYIYKISKKEGEMLRNYFKNFDNELDFNPLFINYNSEYNIKASFAYGFIVSMQGKVGSGAKLWDKSPKLFKFQIKDKSGNLMTLNNSMFTKIEFRKQEENATQGLNWDNNYVYLTENELFLATRENSSCNELIYSSKPLKIEISFNNGNNHYKTIPFEFIPKDNIGKTFTLETQ